MHKFQGWFDPIGRFCVQLKAGEEAELSEVVRYLSNNGFEKVHPLKLVAINNALNAGRKIRMVPTARM
jgi:hypothetical protein